MVTKAFRSGLSAISKYEINWGDWLAPALILVMPFVNFLVFRDYGLFHAESLLAMAILVGLGLTGSLLIALGQHLRLPFLRRPLFVRSLVFAFFLSLFLDVQPEFKNPVVLVMSGIFWDGAQRDLSALIFFSVVFIFFYTVSRAFKQNAGTVVSAVFIVALCATVLLPRTSETPYIITKSSFAIPGEAPRPDLPPIIHIVLDEHIGIEGVPEDVPGGAALRTELKDFYIRNGFRLYGGAFSQYYKTADSIPNLVNATVRSRRLQFVTPSDYGYAVTENAWFDQLGALGYRIHVYQTSYLDFCGSEGHRIANCTVVPASGLGVLADMKAATSEKAGLLISSFTQKSYFRKTAISLASFLRNFGPNREGASEIVPDRRWKMGLGASWARISAERLIDELGKIESGAAYFVHLLLPHRGFILDDNCGMKPDLDSWYDMPHLGLKSGKRLDDSSRQTRYIEYFKQVRCARRTMEEVLEALSRAGHLDKAIIIVHGDHGSRIAGLWPLQSIASSLTRSDLTDSFSTLFAIRSPDLPAGYDSGVRSIQALFAELVYGRAVDDERAVVFLLPRKDEPGAAFGEIPFPGFN